MLAGDLSTVSFCKYLNCVKMIWEKTSREPENLSNANEYVFDSFDGIQGVVHVMSADAGRSMWANIVVRIWSFSRCWEERGGRLTNFIWACYTTLFNLSMISLTLKNQLLGQKTKNRSDAGLLMELVTQGTMYLSSWRKCSKTQSERYC